MILFIKNLRLFPKKMKNGFKKRELLDSSSDV